MKKNLIPFTFLLFTTKFFVSVIVKAQIIAAGGGHSLIVCNDSTVLSWGHNSSGELGNGSNYDSNVPVTVSSLTGISAVAGGHHHSLALRKDSTVWAWGSGGRLGNGTYNSSNVPVPVSFLTNISAIAAGWGHSLALKNDGTVWAWGSYNDDGQLGIGTNTMSLEPVQIHSLQGIVAISAGRYHSLALRKDGTVWTWGLNANGQLGIGTNMDSNVPVQINTLENIIAIDGGWHHSIALKNDGTVWTWGENEYGQLGNGTIINSNIPVQVDLLQDIIAIAEGTYHHSLALKNDGTVWTWGRNNVGQLGEGTNTDHLIPVQVNFLTDIIAIAGGSVFSLALDENGVLWSWGSNAAGALGNGTNSNSNTPVQVVGQCPLSTAKNEIKSVSSLAFTVFPNPSGKELTLNFSSSIKSEFLFSIKNSLGQTVYSERKKDFEGEYINTINLSGQPSGIYFVEVVCGENRKTEKIIIE